MGAQALRDEALQDDRVLDLLDEHFIVQWVNVRAEAIPDFPARDDIAHAATIDEEGRVRDIASLGYFLRLLVLDPVDLELLNPQASTAEGSMQQFFDVGHFAYAQVKAEPVLAMLEDALEAFEDRRDD